MNTQYLNDNYIPSIQASQFSTGAVFDATGSPAYSVYEDATTTKRATGTLSKTDSQTGYYAASAVALTVANGFQVGHCYQVRLTATVDSVAAGQVIDRFILRYAPASLEVKVPGEMWLNETIGLAVQLSASGNPTDGDAVDVAFEISTMGQIVKQSGTLLQVGGHARTGLYSGGVVLSTANGFAVGTAYYVRVTAQVNGTPVVGSATFQLRNPITSDSSGTVTASTYLTGNSPGMGRIS